jgi:hypothetical protein
VSHVVVDNRNTREANVEGIVRALGVDGTATLVPLRKDGTTAALTLSDAAEHRGEILGLVTVANDLARLDVRVQIKKNAKPFRWPADMEDLATALNATDALPSGLLVLNGKTGKGRRRSP